MADILNPRFCAHLPVRLGPSIMRQARPQMVLTLHCNAAAPISPEAAMAGDTPCVKHSSEGSAGALVPIQKLRHIEICQRTGRLPAGRFHSGPPTNQLPQLPQAQGTQGTHTHTGSLFVCQGGIAAH